MQATTHISQVAPPLPAPSSPGPRHRQPDPLHDLDRVIESSVGADLRLLYGMTGPMLLVVGLIIAFALSGSYALAGVSILIEIGCLGFIVTKLLAMLDEPDEETGSAEIAADSPPPLP